MSEREQFASANKKVPTDAVSQASMGTFYAPKAPAQAGHCLPVWSTVVSPGRRIWEMGTMV